MFLGQYHHSLDAKGRITVPARFREGLSSGAFLTQGFDKALRILTSASFERISEIVNLMSTTDPNTRMLQRLIYSKACGVELDSIGRILIPQFLRDFAGLENDAIVVGVGHAIEIWSPEEWLVQENILQDVEANSERFASLDLPM